MMKIEPKTYLLKVLFLFCILVPENGLPKNTAPQNDSILIRNDSILTRNDSILTRNDSILKQIEQNTNKDIEYRKLVGSNEAIDIALLSLIIAVVTFYSQWKTQKNTFQGNRKTQKLAFRMLLIKLVENIEILLLTQKIIKEGKDIILPDNFTRLKFDVGQVLDSPRIRKDRHYVAMYRDIELCNKNIEALSIPYKCSQANPSENDIKRAILVHVDLINSIFKIYHCIKGHWDRIRYNKWIYGVFHVKTSYTMLEKFQRLGLFMMSIEEMNKKVGTIKDETLLDFMNRLNKREAKSEYVVLSETNLFELLNQYNIDNGGSEDHLITLIKQDYDYVFLSEALHDIDILRQTVVYEIVAKNHKNVNRSDPDEVSKNILRVISSPKPVKNNELG